MPSSLTDAFESAAFERPAFQMDEEAEGPPKFQVLAAVFGRRPEEEEREREWERRAREEEEEELVAIGVL